MKKPAAADVDADSAIMTQYKGLSRLDTVEEGQPLGQLTAQAITDHLKRLFDNRVIDKLSFVAGISKVSLTEGFQTSNSHRTVS